MGVGGEGEWRMAGTQRPGAGALSWRRAADVVRRDRPWEGEAWEGEAEAAIGGGRVGVGVGKLRGPTQWQAPGLAEAPRQGVELAQAVLRWVGVEPQGGGKKR